MYSYFKLFNFNKRLYKTYLRFSWQSKILKSGTVVRCILLPLLVLLTAMLERLLGNYDEIETLTSTFIYRRKSYYCNNVVFIWQQRVVTRTRKVFESNDSTFLQEIHKILEK